MITDMARLHDCLRMAAHFAQPGTPGSATVNLGLRTYVDVMRGVVWRDLRRGQAAWDVTDQDILAEAQQIADFLAEYREYNPDANT